MEIRRRAANWLQWSRDHVIAERKRLPVTLPMRASLQWSRDHVIAESSGLVFRLSREEGFNGAAIN